MTKKAILKGVIDRFEGDLAVIEIADETEPRNVPRKRLPQGAKEGDYLQLEIEDQRVTLVHLRSRSNTGRTETYSG